MKKGRGIYIEKSYTNATGIVLAYISLAVILVCYFGGVLAHGFNLQYFVCIISIVVGLTLLIYSATNSRIILENDMIYCYSGFFKKSYHISSIAGIKLTVAFCNCGYGKDGVYRDLDGNAKYIVFYLKNVNSEIRSFNGKTGLSTKFIDRFKKAILFSSVYDERVIQYLKTINPNIEIMD